MRLCMYYYISDYEAIFCQPIGQGDTQKDSGFLKYLTRVLALEHSVQWPKRKHLYQLTSIFVECRVCFEPQEQIAMEDNSCERSLSAFIHPKLLCLKIPPFILVLLVFGFSCVLYQLTILLRCASTKYCFFQR